MSGPIGYIFHQSSGKLVHPKGGSPNPGNDTRLVVNSAKNNPGRLQVRFVPVQGYGHFGYIEHVSSGKIVHPSGGSLDPGNDTQLVYHGDRHSGALFGFDEENYEIKHIGGKIWHPSGGSPNPGNDTVCVLHSDRHAAAKFYFGDIDGNPVSPYPSPNLSGDWKLLRAFIMPETDHTYTVNYKVGTSQTRSTTTQVAWRVSAGIDIKKVFNASAELSGFVEKTSSITWTKERSESHTIKVTKGESIVVWQYVFAMEQYGDEWSFQSTIIGDTNSLDYPANFFGSLAS